MVATNPAEEAKRKRSRRRPGRLAQAAPLPSPPLAHAALLAEARRKGLLDGDKTEHVSFRAPPALVEAAKRETGVTSTTELGLLALAMLAQPDPVVALMRRTRGSLGEDHTLE